MIQNDVSALHDGSPHSLTLDNVHRGTSVISQRVEIMTQNQS